MKKSKLIRETWRCAPACAKEEGESKLVGRLYAIKGILCLLFNRVESRYDESDWILVVIWHRRNDKLNRRGFPYAETINERGFSVERGLKNWKGHMYSFKKEIGA